MTPEKRSELRRRLETIWDGGDEDGELDAVVRTLIKVVAEILDEEKETENGN